MWNTECIYYIYNTQYALGLCTYIHIHTHMDGIKRIKTLYICGTMCRRLTSSESMCNDGFGDTLSKKKRLLLRLLDDFGRVHGQ